MYNYTYKGYDDLSSIKLPQSLMEQQQQTTISSYLALNSLLSLSILQETKTDFLTFVRLMAPTLISDWRMGRHIELISN